jgi:hypothetical protein
MGRVYAGQSALRISLKTYTDLEGIVSAAIRYRRPDGVLGSFPAGVSDSGKGVIFHECIEGELDLAGWWAFWAFVTFADERVAAGETAKVFVWEEGG